MLLLSIMPPRSGWEDRVFISGTATDRSAISTDRTSADAARCRGFISRHYVTLELIVWLMAGGVAGHGQRCSHRDLFRGFAGLQYAPTLQDNQRGLLSSGAAEHEHMQRVRFDVQSELFCVPFNIACSDWVYCVFGVKPHMSYYISLVITMVNCTAMLQIAGTKMAPVSTDQSQHSNSFTIEVCQTCEIEGSDTQQTVRQTELNVPKF